MDAREMTDLLDKAKALTTGFHTGHSRFQIEHFIIGKQGTPYAQLQQCKREIQVRLGEAEKQDANAEREIGILVELAERLVTQVGELTPERAEELEAASWRDKARRKIDTDFMAYGRPTESTIEFVLSLPTYDQDAMLVYMKHKSDRRELDRVLASVPQLEA